jgi:hypothetical protein
VGSGADNPLPAGAQSVVRQGKPIFGLMWLLWMALGMPFFFAEAYGVGA